MEIIKYKKIKNNIYEITFDDQTIIKLYDDVIVKYNLLSNKVLDQAKFNEITAYNDSLDAYYLAIKYLNVKLRSELEINKYLEKKAFNSKVIKDTIEKLNKDGYLDHQIYLKSYINDAFNFSNNGPDKIKYNLIKLGFKEDEIEPFLNLDFSLKIKSIIDKKVKFNHKLSNNALKIYLSNYLVNLGYPKEMFYSLVSKININNASLIKKDYELLLKKYHKEPDKEKVKYIIKDKLYKKGYNIDEISEVLK